MSDAPPDLIADRYRLVEPLGQGGMGRVWKARDEVLHRDVAIKELVPPPSLTADERREMRERSLREARAIARLNHINVVRVFDVLRTDGDPWIVMEYVASRSLQDTLAADGPVSPVRAAEIGLGVLGALNAAHRAGVMHRDVKPGNVLLGEDGRVVLTDFGLATVPGDPNVTRTGLVLGSPAYIAPERARDGTAGPEGDLWSLGATLYAAVEGQSPFARPSAIATLAALATESPPPAKRAGPLKAVLNGLLRKDPTQRINAEVAERLLRRAAGRRTRPGLALFEGARRPSPLGPRPERTRIVPLPAQRPPHEQTDPPSTPPAPPPVTSGAPVPTTPPVPPAAETTKLPASADAPAGETTKLPADARPAEMADGDGAQRSRKADSGTSAEPLTDVEEDASDGQSAVVDAPVTVEQTMVVDQPPPTGPERAASERAASERTVPEQREAESPSKRADQPTRTSSEPAERKPSGTPQPEATDGAAGPWTGVAEATRRIVASVPAAVPALAGRARVAADRIRPSSGADPDGRSGLSRNRRLLLALVAVLLLGMLLAVPWLLDGQKKDDPSAEPSTGQQAATPTAPAASPTAAPSPTTPAATPTATAAPTPTAPATGGGLGPPVVPAGWYLHRDPTGFQVPVPNGWRVRRESYGPAADEVRVTFSDPRDGRWLLIDQTNHPKSDPEADWRQQEPGRRGRYANYRRIKIATIDYWDKAADWEWTYTDDNGAARHTVNRGFVTARDKAYAIRWDTPAGAWEKNLAVLQVIADGFRPVRS